jgi:hypothetical protein
MIKEIAAMLVGITSVSSDEKLTDIHAVSDYARVFLREMCARQDRICMPYELAPMAWCIAFMLNGGTTPNK